MRIEHTHPPEPSAANRTPQARGPLAALTLLRGDGRKRCNQLVYPFAAAVRTTYLGLLNVGGMILLGEFLVAILAVKNVL